jgi:hypothetical protein
MRDFSLNFKGNVVAVGVMVIAAIISFAIWDIVSNIK